MHAKICRINHIINNTVFSIYIGLLPDEITSQDELISTGKGIAKLFVSTWVKDFLASISFWLMCPEMRFGTFVWACILKFF